MADTDTFSNTFNSNGGHQTIVQGAGAIGKQINNTYTAEQVPAEDLLKIIEALKERLPHLPEEVRAEVAHEVAGAELQARKEKPDSKKIAATLKTAQDVLKAVPGTVAAALPVGKLLGEALIWCAKATGV